MLEGLLLLSKISKKTFFNGSKTIVTVSHSLKILLYVDKDLQDFKE